MLRPLSRSGITPPETGELVIAEHGVAGGAETASLAIATHRRRRCEAARSPSLAIVSLEVIGQELSLFSQRWRSRERRTSNRDAKCSEHDGQQSDSEDDRISARFGNAVGFGLDSVAQEFTDSTAAQRRSFRGSSSAEGAWSKGAPAMPSHALPAASD